MQPTNSTPDNSPKVKDVRGYVTFTATKEKKFTLTPIGKIRFSFENRKDCIYIGDLQINHETSMKMDDLSINMVMKMMKENQTEVLTNGVKFYTRTGNNITEISHESFADLLK